MIRIVLIGRFFFLGRMVTVDQQRQREEQGSSYAHGRSQNSRCGHNGGAISAISAYVFLQSCVNSKQKINRRWESPFFVVLNSVILSTRRLTSRYKSKSSLTQSFSWKNTQQVIRSGGRPHNQSHLFPLIWRRNLTKCDWPSLKKETGDHYKVRLPFIIDILYTKARRFPLTSAMNSLR